MARPKTFEPEEALLAIKKVFWEKGYEGTSMFDLQEATGLKKQSLYREFGEKRGMYLKALQHYNRHEVDSLRETLLTGRTAKDGFSDLFNQIIDDVMLTGDRKGCFLCNSSVDQAQLNAQSRDVVEQGVLKTREIFRKALQEDKSDSGEKDAVTAQLMSAYFGLRVLIKANAPESWLRDAVRQAVAVL